MENVQINVEMGVHPPPLYITKGVVIYTGYMSAMHKLHISCLQSTVQATVKQYKKRIKMNFLY